MFVCFVDYFFVVFVIPYSGFVVCECVLARVSTDEAVVWRTASERTVCTCVYACGGNFVYSGCTSLRTIILTAIGCGSRRNGSTNLFFRIAVVILSHIVLFCFH